MNPHDFNQSILVESSYHELANNFYIDRLKAEKIIRYTSSSILDLSFQKKDIDVTIIKNGKPIHFSEKFRNKNYGDIYLELYSKYPNKLGWMDSSEADFISYFVPNQVIILNKKSITEFYHTILIPSINLKEIDTFHKNYETKNSTQKIELFTQNYTYYATLIQAFNNTENSLWHTIGISIKLKDLDYFKIKYSIKDIKF